MRDKKASQISAQFGFAHNRCTAYARDGMPHDKTKLGNRYDPDEVALWMKQHNLTGKTGKPIQPESDEIRAWKLRRKKALALKAERENVIAEGKLIDSVAEQARDVQKIAHVRNRLTGLGAALSPQLVGLEGAEINTLIDNAVQAILTEFSKST
jgi:hypothetical protein